MPENVGCRRQFGFLGFAEENVLLSLSSGCCERSYSSELLEMLSKPLLEFLEEMVTS
jgi:hypothetical protein